VDEWLYHKFYELESKHWWFVGRERIVLDLAKNRCALRPGARVLDVGCGTGGVLAEFSRDYDAFGIDSSPLAIDLCGKRGLKNVSVGLLQDLPKDSVGFDLIMFLDVIEHIADDAGVLRAASEHLAPAGSILITVPAYPWLWSAHDEANHHQRRYTRKTLIDTLARASLVPTFISYLNTFLFPAALLERFAAKMKRSQEQDAGLKMPPNWLNKLLTKTFASERLFLRSMRFPFGLSLVAIARKS
jgi:2-polyprenyl-3-methyl-5-hydroxy-6-metoxy-1,4-benzoquinol methylase